MKTPVVDMKQEKINEQMLNDCVIANCGICRNLFHGTKKNISQEIAKTKKTEESDSGYLGYGFYCYQYDVEASRIWARKKYPNEKIAVLKLVTNLRNVFFVCDEIKKILRRKVEELRPGRTDKINKYIGHFVDIFINDVIKSRCNMNIQTVIGHLKLKVKGQERSTLTYSLRDEKMIKEIGMYWEE